jgi:hypothetical protein
MDFMKFLKFNIRKEILTDCCRAVPWYPYVPNERVDPGKLSDKGNISVLKHNCSKCGKI